MKKRARFALRALCVVNLVTALTASAQIDPDPRQILHLGYNAPLNGNGPAGAYAFYYWNMPNVPATNIFLRLAIAPTYVDSEIGFKGLFAPNTDLGVGVFGGAFANNYNDITQGVYNKKQSFEGISGGTSASIYQLLNPDARVPLSAILRESITYNAWGETSDTAGNFERPNNQSILTTRAGLRWGGKEPVLWPTLAMELSAWYELDKRTDPGGYGFNDDRRLNSTPQRVFGRALLDLTTLESKQYIQLNLVGGAAFDSDRLSCFRLGGMLPYTKEFPLRIPGYYFQELSAQDFGLVFANYAVPFGPDDSLYAIVSAGAALVKYEEDMGQPGAFNSGIGGGLGYAAPSRRWKLISQFGYGFQAERSHGRGGMTLSFAFQYNFGQTKLASDEAYEEWKASAEKSSPVSR